MVLLALATMLPLARAQQSAEAMKERWGPTVEVLVMTRSVDSGAQLADHVDALEMPRSFVPADAVADLASGAVAATPLFAGEVLVSDRVVPDPSAMSTDMVAIGVPRSGLVPTTVTPGQRVLLVLTLDPFGIGEQTMVAGRITSTDDGFVMVSIPRANLGPVMAALSQGTVGLAITN